MRARVVLRAAALTLLTLAIYLARLGLRPLAWARPRLAQELHGRSTRCWARGVARIVGMRVQVEGQPPRAPFLLVANHLAYADILALWCTVSADFLAKSEIAGWPFIGHLARSAGTLFIDRTRATDLPRVLGALGEVLGERRGVILFPEGTSSEGAGVLPFRPSLFEAALRAGYPVHCAVLTYVTPPGAEPARTSVCWWGGMSFLGHLPRLLALPGFEARVTFLPGAVSGASRKELATNAQRRIAAAFTPVTGSGPAADAEATRARP